MGKKPRGSIVSVQTVKGVPVPVRVKPKRTERLPGRGVNTAT